MFFLLYTVQKANKTFHKGTCEKESVNTLPKAVGFLQALRFPPTGKLTGWVRINTDREVKSQLL